MNNRKRFAILIVILFLASALCYALPILGRSSGTVIADKTIYAGFSLDGFLPMYVMPCDLGMVGTHNNCEGVRSTYSVRTFISYMEDDASSVTNETAILDMIMRRNAQYNMNSPAARACASQTYGGYNDWYVPTEGELEILYANREAIGGFDTSGSYYWSSSKSPNNNNYVAIEQFNDGTHTSSFGKPTGYEVRCVRK